MSVPSGMTLPAFLAALTDRLQPVLHPKPVLAKWLAARKPNVLILDHPLCGLDAGAREEIMSLIGKFARDGIGILLVADTTDPEFVRRAG